MSLAIISGASSGIGREFALQLKAMRGVEKFWLIARSTERMEKLAEELGSECKILSLDLSCDEGVNEFIRELEAEKPSIDFLVLAAGFGVFGAFDKLSDRTVSDMIDLNVKAVVRMTHAAVPYMKRGGRIIQLGSGSCFTPLPHFNIYSSSKVFVLHYTKSLNYELKPYGVRATCFCPGWVDTEFLPKSLNVEEGVMAPASMKPLLKASSVVRGCIKASVKGRAMYVTNWYTKLQHLLFKLVPDPILTRLWLGMLKKR